MDDIKKFYEEAKKDSQLQEKIKALHNNMNMEGIEDIITLAKERGYEFTKEDILAYARKADNADSKKEELDESDLEAVSGGVPGYWDYDDE